MHQVDIVEVAPRDGLQNEQVILPTEAKIELVARSVAAGTRRVEVTSFVNPKRVPQMSDAEAVMAGVPRSPDTSYIGLVLNKRGLDRALDAGVDEVNAVIVATETFSRRNQGCSIDEAVATWADVAAAAHRVGLRASATIAAAFGCPFEGDVPASHVVSLAQRVAEANPDEIALADTIGVGVPAQVRSLLPAVRGVAPGVSLRCHFHNTRNTGYANAEAALASGATALDASTGGIGGCPFSPTATGNIATEDLLYLLGRSNVQTGVSLPDVIDTASWLSAQLGSPVPALLGRAGTFPRPTTPASHDFEQRH